MSPSVSDDLGVRLEALHADLAGASEDAPCSPEVARLFNTLLRLAKSELADDPVLRGVKALTFDDGGERPSLATVRVLAGQLVVAGTTARSSRGSSSRRR